MTHAMTAGLVRGFDTSNKIGKKHACNDVIEDAGKRISETVSLWKAKLVLHETCHDYLMASEG